MLSVPNGDELEAALGELDSAGRDRPLRQRDQHATPTTCCRRRRCYEREDFPLPFLALFTTPFIQATEAVVEPRGEARQEWEVIEEIAAPDRRRRPRARWPLRQLGRLGGSSSRRGGWSTLLLRTGPSGDRFGLRRGGLSLAELRENPHGIVLAEHLRGGRAARQDPPPTAGACGSTRRRSPPRSSGCARANGDDPDFPLRLIGLRELRSHNSWMHNSPTADARRARATRRGSTPTTPRPRAIEDGDACRISSAHGAIETARAASPTRSSAGTIAVPHGWGHAAAGGRANAAGGVNVNLLASTDPDDLERLAGMAHLNGIPIRLEPVAGAAQDERPATAEVPA